MNSLFDRNKIGWPDRGENWGGDAGWFFYDHFLHPAGDTAQKLPDVVDTATDLPMYLLIGIGIVAAVIIVRGKEIATVARRI